ncbi:MAG: hypothetical protein ACSI46_02910 [Gloeotrichia echinulata DVL01]|jgi:hypothetical protein|nr:hypothetical protein [Gloeotrichia echinulata DEX184]
MSRYSLVKGIPALHNCGMKSLNSTLKTLPLCAFAPLRETKIIPLISNARIPTNKLFSVPLISDQTGAALQQFSHNNDTLRAQQCCAPTNICGFIN